MTTRKDIANAFRQVRGTIRLTPGERRFLCHELEAIGTPAAISAKAIIQDRINLAGYFNNCAGLEEWLVIRGPVASQTYLTPKVMRQYRLRWLDALIEEFDPA